MRNLLRVLVAFVSCICLASPAFSRSTESEAEVSLAHTGRLPGVDVAEGISQITGVAISPLLGVTASGAWRYFRTPPEMRNSLPWFCHPAAWGAGLVLLGVCLFKDTLGPVTPTVLKKPLDMAELFESKTSALLASAAFVPFIAAQMAEHFSAEQAGRNFFQLPAATVIPLASVSVDLTWFFIPLGIAAFLVVWVTGHAVNVLIALSPFGIIDTFLKLSKIGLLALVTVSYFLNPYLGAAISLAVITIAAILAPSAFRFMVFGTLFATDTIFPWRAKRAATPDLAHAFIAVKTAGVPTRTYGRVSRSADGVVRFTFRPWLVLPRRSVQFPDGLLAVSRGVYFPSLLHTPSEKDNHIRIITFLPRYRKHEMAIARHLGITDIKDSTLTRGFKAARAWLTETVSIGKRKIALAAPALKRPVA